MWKKREIINQWFEPSTLGEVLDLSRKVNDNPEQFYNLRFDYLNDGLMLKIAADLILDEAQDDQSFDEDQMSILRAAHLAASHELSAKKIEFFDSILGPPMGYINVTILVLLFMVTLIQFFSIPFLLNPSKLLTVFLFSVGLPFLVLTGTSQYTDVMGAKKRVIRYQRVVWPGS